MFRTIKPEIRIIGFDDTPFDFSDKYTFILGVICRGGIQIDGLVSERIKVDGNDATKKISEVINKSKHKEQLRIIMLDGITFGGFNIVDIEELYKKTNLPVIVIIKEKPNIEAIKTSLKAFKDFENRWKILEKAGEIQSVEIENKVVKKKKKIYYQKFGIDDYICEKIIKMTSVHSVIPEPIRVAHIICNGLKNIRKI